MRRDSGVGQHPQHLRLTLRTRGSLSYAHYVMTMAQQAGVDSVIGGDCARTCYGAKQERIKSLIPHRILQDLTFASYVIGSSRRWLARVNIYCVVLLWESAEDAVALSDRMWMSTPMIIAQYAMRRGHLTHKVFDLLC